MWGPRPRASFVEGDIRAPFFAPAYGMQHQGDPVLLRRWRRSRTRWSVTSRSSTSSCVLSWLLGGACGRLRLDSGVAAAAAPLAPHRSGSAGATLRERALRHRHSGLHRRSASSLLSGCRLMDGSAPCSCWRDVSVAAASTKMGRPSVRRLLRRGGDRRSRGLPGATPVSRHCIGALRFRCSGIAVDRTNERAATSMASLRDPGYAAEAASSIPVAADGLPPRRRRRLPLASSASSRLASLACIARPWSAPRSSSGLWAPWSSPALLVACLTRPPVGLGSWSRPGIASSSRSSWVSRQLRRSSSRAL